jgi:hypothetical protein
MQITDFSISEDRTQLNVVIIDAATISSLKFWTNLTYKDFSLAIDLTSKLTASSTENITITLSDVGLSYFDGVYFLEAEDPDELSSAIESDLTRYKECIVNKLAEFSVCDDCLEKDSNSLLNAHALLTGLEDAIEQGWINEILLFISSLNKYCSNDCITCGKRNNITDTNYYSSND